jgi:hypothetical protein
MSRWTLSTFQFNRQWEFSWLAQNLTPLRNQKIHWRSVPGSVGGSLGAGLEVANRCVLLSRGRREGSAAGRWRRPAACRGCQMMELGPPLT